MRPAGQALVAAAAGDGRIDRHAIARPEAGHRAAGLDNRAGAFVTQRGRIGEHLVADAAVEVIVYVRAADADALDPQQHVAGRLERRRRQVGDFDSFAAGKSGGFHGGSQSRDR